MVLLKLSIIRGKLRLFKSKSTHLLVVCNSYIVLTISRLSAVNADNELVSVFGSVQDLRSHINQLYNLADILLIGIIAVIYEAETWKQMIEFANSKEDFFEEILGITEWNTFGRLYK